MVTKSLSVMRDLEATARMAKLEAANACLQEAMDKLGTIKTLENARKMAQGRLEVQASIVAAIDAVTTGAPMPSNLATLPGNRPAAIDTDKVKAAFMSAPGVSAGFSKE